MNGKCWIVVAGGVAVGVLLVGIEGWGSGRQQPQAAPVSEMAERLAPGASTDEIARHALEARRTLRMMPSLVTAVPDLDRRRAYDIQLAMLKMLERTERRTGWKIGWSRVSANQPLDPVFGYSMQSDVYQPGSTIPASKFVGGSPAVETEVVVWVGTDLRGPRVTREEILAVAEVAPAIELIARRLPSGHTREHAIVDTIYHAGVLLGTRRVKPGAVDFATETGRVEVNGVVKAEGATRSIMGKDPIEAMVWIANELIKYGQYLRAGDYVVTGTVASPPAVRAGDKVRVIFSTLGSVEFALD